MPSACHRVSSSCAALVALVAVGLVGQVDQHCVVRVAAGELGPLGGVDHVVRRGDHPPEVAAGQVIADAGERLEAGHDSESARLVRWASHSTSTACCGSESKPIPGAAEAVARLRSAGDAVVFCTNNSMLSRWRTWRRSCARHGIPATAGDVVTSAMAAAALVEPGERVLVCGGPGVVEAIERRGADPGAGGPR